MAKAKLSQSGRELQRKAHQSGSDVGCRLRLHADCAHALDIGRLDASGSSKGRGDWCSRNSHSSLPELERPETQSSIHRAQYTAQAV